MKTDGSGERILTEGFHNEGPAWSPNGPVIAFFRESKGADGGPKLWTVDVTGYNEQPDRGPRLGIRPGMVAAHPLDSEFERLSLHAFAGLHFRAVLVCKAV